MEPNRKSKIANRNLLAAAIVAFNPQFLFTSGLITNDALLTTLSALLLWLVVRDSDAQNDGAVGSTRSGLRTLVWCSAMIGLVLGLALLTKQSAAILVPVALLGAARLGRQSLTRALAAALLALAVALLVSGWWYWRNLQLYGDPLGLAAFQAEFAGQPFDPRSLAAWGGALAQLHSSFWARFGWMNVRPPGWVISLFAAIEVLALVGWARQLVRKIRGRRHETGDMRASLVSYLVSPVSVFWPVLALPALALTWLVSFALAAGLVAWQGRLLFPALPAIAIVLACGLAALRRPTTDDRRTPSGSESWAQRGGWWSGLGGLFLLALWLPLGVIGPAYPRQTLPERVALAQLGTPIFGRLGLRGEPGAELRGWQLNGDLRPGATAELTLTWHALGRQNRDWTVFVHLVGAGEQIVAQSNAQPRGGAFPMSQWVAGDWLHDQHALALPGELAAGSYELRVGLYDTRTGRRTGVFNQKGRLIGDYLTLGKIDLVR